MKPTNVLIYLPEGSSVPQIKVADFGLSKLLNVNQDDFTNSNLINPSGTRGWMAPESYNQKRFGFEVDIWAFGLLFAYTLSGGKHPFGDEPDERQNRIKKRKPMILVQQDLKKLYSENRPEAFKLIHSMLEMEPTLRPVIEDIKSSTFFNTGSVIST